MTEPFSRLTNCTYGSLLKAIESRVSNYPFLIVSTIDITGPGDTKLLKHSINACRDSLTGDSVANISAAAYTPVSYLQVKGEQKPIGAFDQTESCAAGYIVIGYKLLNQELPSDNLENSWLTWSGARLICKCSSRLLALRRVTLYRTNDSRMEFAYVLTAEFGQIYSNTLVRTAIDLVEGLRARNCGHATLYFQLSSFLGKKPDTDPWTLVDPRSEQGVTSQLTNFESKSKFRQSNNLDPMLSKVPEKSKPAIVDNSIDNLI